MVYLAAATVFVGLLGLLNLVLTLAVVRRLRTLKDGSGRRAPVRVVPGLRTVGSKAPHFAATTTTGRSAELASLAGRHAVIGFFSGTCEPCRDHLPGFVRVAGQLAEDSGQAIAVIRGTDEETADLLGLINDDVMVIREPEGGPVGTAFAVKTYPALYLLDGSGTITSAAHVAEHLSLPVLR